MNFLLQDLLAKYKKKRDFGKKNAKKMKIKEIEEKKYERKK